MRLTKEEISSIRDDPAEPLSRILPAEGAEEGAYRVLVMQLADLERLWQVLLPLLSGRCSLPSSCSSLDAYWMGAPLLTGCRGKA